jgi:hypothetical protein
VEEKDKFLIEDKSEKYDVKIVEEEGTNTNAKRATILIL